MTGPDTSLSDRTATIALAGAAALAGVAIVAWVAAAAAAVLTGQNVPDLADAAGALPRLTARPAHPAAAWPRLGYVNPVLYWACQLTVLGTFAALGRLLWPTLRRWRAATGQPLGVGPNAGITRRIPTLTVGRPTSGRLTLGRAGRHLIAAEPAASLAVIGPTGCGKTAGLAIPAILEWDGPVLAASVKTDLLDATHRHRDQAGTVWVYDPAETAPNIAGSGWSPLDAIGSWADAGKVAASLCDAARPRAGLTDADYWITQAAKALAPHLYLAAQTGKSIGDVVDWVDTQADDPLHEKLVGDARGDSQAALQAFRSLWMKEERLRSSIYATVETVLLAYTDPGVQHAATIEPRINPATWLTGNNTIYLLAPSHEQARLRPVFTLAAQTAIRAAYDLANRNGGTLPKPCLILLDEAGNTAPLPDLAAYATTARSHGITLVTVWQDLAQLTDRYGRQAKTVLNNHRARLFGRGIADEQTLRYLSALIGDTPHKEMQHSADLTAGRRSINEHTTWRPAAPPDALRRLPDNTAVLLYGAEPAARIQLRPWYLERTLRRTNRQEPSGPTVEERQPK